MKQIRVLHTEWSDGWGGQEIRIINEMLAVREKGVEVFLACRDHAKIKQKALENGIKVFTLPFNGSFDIKTILALKKIIKDYHIDIINTHSGKDTWVGGIAAKLSKAKFIRTRHLSNPINPSRLNFINEWADFVFTTGESVKDAMIQNNRINPDKIISIPTGIDADIFDKNRYNKKECRNIFEIEDNEVAIGILAVLRSFKRHDIFLNIAKKLKDNFNNQKFKFLIAGDGPKKDSIVAQIKESGLTDSVIMIGHIDNTAEFLRALDIFVLTSDKNEGVPQSLMQALFMETPAVATTAGSIKDLYKENNFLISEPIEDKIYNNIEAYLLKKKNIIPNRKFMMENFSKESSTNKILSIYNSLTEKTNDKTS